MSFYQMLTLFFIGFFLGRTADLQTSKDSSFMWIVTCILSAIYLPLTFGIIVYKSLFSEKGQP